jgi:hypothetical protein
MVAPTCFGITLPSSGSVSSAFWEMLNWGAVDRILWIHNGFSRIFLLGILIFKGLTARRLHKPFGVKGLIQRIWKNKRQFCHKCSYVWLQYSLHNIVYLYKACPSESGKVSIVSWTIGTLVSTNKVIMCRQYVLHRYCHLCTAVDSMCYTDIVTYVPLKTVCVTQILSPMYHCRQYVLHRYCHLCTTADSMCYTDIVTYVLL